MTRKRRASEQNTTRQGEEVETHDEQGMPRERQLRTYVPYVHTWQGVIALNHGTIQSGPPSSSPSLLLRLLTRPGGDFLRGRRANPTHETNTYVRTYVRTHEYVSAPP